MLHGNLLHYTIIRPTELTLCPMEPFFRQTKLTPNKRAAVLALRDPCPRGRVDAEHIRQKVLEVEGATEEGTRSQVKRMQKDPQLLERSHGNQRVPAVSELAIVATARHLDKLGTPSYKAEIATLAASVLTDVDESVFTTEWVDGLLSRWKSLVSVRQSNQLEAEQLEPLSMEEIKAFISSHDKLEGPQTYVQKRTRFCQSHVKLT